MVIACVFSVLNHCVFKHKARRSRRKKNQLNHIKNHDHRVIQIRCFENNLMSSFWAHHSSVAYVGDAQAMSLRLLTVLFNSPSQNWLCANVTPCVKKVDTLLTRRIITAYEYSRCYCGAHGLYRTLFDPTACQTSWGGCHLSGLST